MLPLPLYTDASVATSMTSSYPIPLCRYASHHCHAPSCIKSELWNADTGELICRQEGHYGVSAVATKENPYDEIGYVAIPPCLFGSASDGLQPEPYLKYDTNLTSIKWNNNSVTHYGEMAM